MQSLQKAKKKRCEEWKHPQYRKNLISRNHPENSRTFPCVLFIFSSMLSGNGIRHFSIVGHSLDGYLKVEVNLDYSPFRRFFFFNFRLCLCYALRRILILVFFDYVTQFIFKMLVWCFYLIFWYCQSLRESICFLRGWLHSRLLLALQECKCIGKNFGEKRDFLYIGN